MKNTLVFELMASCSFATGCAYMGHRALDFSDVVTLAVESGEVGVVPRVLAPFGLVSGEGKGYGLREGHAGRYEYRECMLFIPFLGGVCELEFCPTNDFRRKGYWLEARACREPDGTYRPWVEGLNLQMCVGVGYGLRAGVNIPEVLDFLLGWTTLDIMCDDVLSDPTPAAEISREAAARERCSGLREQALRGDAQAQCELGLCYLSGSGTLKSTAEAVKWFRKAAEQQYAPAQHQIGLCYYSGEGVGKDRAEGYAWWSLASATNELSAARLALAEKEMSAEEVGEGVERARKLRVKIGGLSADPELRELVCLAGQGDAKSQLELGNRYAHGRGVDKDMWEAVAWWRKAAAQDNAEAQYSLGIAYDSEKGLSTECGCREAVAWYRQAALKAHLGAQERLAASYLRGHERVRDLVEAYAWYALIALKLTPASEPATAGAGVPPDRVDQAAMIAADALLTMGKTLSPEQVAAGKRRAEELKKLVSIRVGRRLW